MIITSELLKNAVVQKLLEIFPDVFIYKEGLTSPSYPNFFINLIQLQCNEQRRGKFLLTFNFEIRYRIAGDPSTDLKLLQNLDNIGIILMGAFHFLNIGDSKIKCENKSYEKVDGVLHFFFNCVEMVENISVEEFIKMEKLNMNMELENGTTI